MALEVRLHRPHADERQFSARLVDYDEDTLVFEDSQGETVTEDRKDLMRIVQLKSERYGKYAC